MSTDFADRLKEALESEGKTYTDVATALGDVTRSGVGHWASGRRAPSTEDIQRVAVALNVNPSWLAWGIGGMRDPIPTADTLDRTPSPTLDRTGTEG